MPVTMANLDDVFTYHPPNEEQAQAYVAIREAAKHLTRIMLLNAPACGDTQAGIRKVREGVMTVNAAIANRGAV